MTKIQDNGEHKNALVTGASSGIGRAISQILLDEGYEVYGIGRNFADEYAFTEYEYSHFHPLVADLTDIEALTKLISQLRRQVPLSVLVNNAGVGYFNLHEKLTAEQIKEMTTVNLMVPMLLCNMLLSDLKSRAGLVCNIASVTAKEINPHGCAYGALKAGLLSFSDSLFAEARKSGLRVCTICPDMTKTQFYRDADFREGIDTDSYLLPEDVAEAFRYILGVRAGTGITELTIKPRKHQLQMKKTRRDKDEL